MATAKMHADEVEIDASLVRRLLAGQFPQWAELPLERVASAGTVNAIYRLGGELAVRLPRIPGGAEDVEREHEWLTRLGPRLPLAAPVPLGRGEPAEGYPFPWSVCRWVEGEHVAIEGLVDPARAAIDLARFIAALRRIDPAGAPRSYRGGPLADQNAGVRQAIAASAGLIDTEAVAAAWEEILRAPPGDGPMVWSHGDLLPGNLLAVDGRLSAVIDFGGMGVTDPACDVIVAWTYLDASSRSVFRDELAVDDATWARARGWVLTIGMNALPYYQETNPAFAATARRMVEEVLTDLGLVDPGPTSPDDIGQ